GSSRAAGGPDGAGQSGPAHAAGRTQRRLRLWGGRGCRGPCERASGHDRLVRDEPGRVFRRDRSGLQPGSRRRGQGGGGFGAFEGLGRATQGRGRLYIEALATGDRAEGDAVAVGPFIDAEEETA